MKAHTAFPDQTPVPTYKHTRLFQLGADTKPYYESMGAMAAAPRNRSASRRCMCYLRTRT